MKRISPRIAPHGPVLLVAAALIAIAQPAIAQTEPSPPKRTATLSYELQDYRGGDWSDWTSVTATTSLHVTGLTANALLFRAERFANSDVGGGVDVYAPLWSRAYGNARVLVTPDAAVVPQVDASGELYQALGDAWEVSAGYRHMRFSDNGVNIATVSAARYFPGWYAQGRVSVVPDAGRTGVSYTGVIRRQSVAERFIEFRGGTGGEVVTVATGQTELRDVRFVLLRAENRTLFSPTVGAMAGSGWQRFDGIPDRLDLSAGIIITF